MIDSNLLLAIVLALLLGLLWLLLATLSIPAEHTYRHQQAAYDRGYHDCKQGKPND